VEGDLLISRILGGIPIQPQQEQEESILLLSEIIANARRGDRFAFTSLFQLYHARIFTYLVHIVGRKEEAEDLAQETFVKAWQSLHQLKNDARFSAWLYTIATHTARDYLRKQKLRQGIWVQPRDDTFSGQEDGRRSSIEAQIAETEHIRMALAQVAQHYRICLLLYYVADCTQREIAASLEMSEKNVNVYIRRGCDQFRQAYIALEKGPISKPRRRTVGRRTIR
jgi:RNA polymerase sigma-70 factor, ECF subfamily